MRLITRRIALYMETAVVAITINFFLPRLMQRLNEVFRVRRSVNITDDMENITGTAPATFRDWCERHADAFR
jgi:hypothetical protein